LSFRDFANKSIKKTLENKQNLYENPEPDMDFKSRQEKRVKEKISQLKNLQISS
jgi:hypothetical protein